MRRGRRCDVRSWIVTAVRGALLGEVGRAVPGHAATKLMQFGGMANAWQGKEAWQTWAGVLGGSLFDPAGLPGASTASRSSVASGGGDTGGDTVDLHRSRGSAYTAEVERAVSDERFLPRPRPVTRFVICDDFYGFRIWRHCPCASGWAPTRRLSTASARAWGRGARAAGPVGAGVWGLGVGGPPWQQGVRWHQRLRCGGRCGRGWRRRWRRGGRPRRARRAPGCSGSSCEGGVTGSGRDGLCSAPHVEDVTDVVVKKAIRLAAPSLDAAHVLKEVCQPAFANRYCSLIPDS
jgi:hypothetical protein